MANDRVPLKARVDAVKDHALRNYEKGWDVVIETMTDWDIAAIIEGTSTTKGAIWKVSCEIGPFVEYRREIVATADY